MLILPFSFWRGGVSTAEAAAQVSRIGIDGGYVFRESKIDALIRDLKTGSGGSGDCYAIFDGIWIPGCCKKDAANKISKIYDLSAYKGAGVGTGGYYDAEISIASNQQSLGRTDNAGNFVLNSGNLNASSWTSAGATATTATANAVTFGSSADSERQQNCRLRINATYKLRVLASGTKVFRLKFYNGAANTYSSDITPNGTPTWYEFSYTVSSITGLSSNISIANQSAGGVGTVTIDAVHLIESTWDSTYITTVDRVTFPAQDGWPVVQMLDNLDGFRSSVNVVSKNQPGTVYCVHRREGHLGDYQGVFDFDTGRWLYGYQNNNTTVQMYAGAVFSGAFSNQFVFGRHMARFDGASSFVKVNGTTIASGNCGGNAGNGRALLGVAQDGFKLRGLVTFWGLIRQPMTAAQEAHIQSTLAAHFPSLT